MSVEVGTPNQAWIASTLTNATSKTSAPPTRTVSIATDHTTATVGTATNIEKKSTGASNFTNVNIFTTAMKRQKTASIQSAVIFVVVKKDTGTMDYGLVSTGMNASSVIMNVPRLQPVPILKGLTFAHVKTDTLGTDGSVTTLMNVSTTLTSAQTTFSVLYPPNHPKISRMFVSTYQAATYVFVQSVTKVMVSNVSTSTNVRIPAKLAT